jgi:pimeloyl-ACP methyl ester carboxylesterase
MNEMCEVALSAGEICYREEGRGRPIVFVHGLFTNGTLWRKVIAGLPRERLRCISPDLPLGSHVKAMRAGADLSPTGVAMLLAEFLRSLDLQDVTLVASDTGGAIAQLLLAEQPDRVARLVLTPCDAFENFFPPLFRPLQYAARSSIMLNAVIQPLRIRVLRRLPLAFGWLAKHPIPAAVTDGWLNPFLIDPAVRNDTAKFIRAVDSRALLAATDRLSAFDRPVLIAWASEDRVFPLEHARRLASIFPSAELTEVSDSYTFISEDQPARLARLIAGFVLGEDPTPLKSPRTGGDA